MVFLNRKEVGDLLYCVLVILPAQQERTMVFPGHFLSFPFRAPWFLFVISSESGAQPNPTLGPPWPGSGLWLIFRTRVCVIKRSMWTSGETTGLGEKLGLLPAVP